MYQQLNHFVKVSRRTGRGFPLPLGACRSAQASGTGGCRFPVFREGFRVARAGGMAPGDMMEITRGADGRNDHDGWGLKCRQGSNLEGTPTISSTLWTHGGGLERCVAEGRGDAGE